MCSLRGSLCSGILLIPVGTKLPSKLPNAPLQPLSGQGGILQALEPAWESKEAVSVSLGAGFFGDTMVVGAICSPRNQFAFLNKHSSKL